MKKFVSPAILLGLLLLVPLTLVLAQAGDIVVGVNMVSPQHRKVAEQDAMLADVKSAGVRVIRTGITPDDLGGDFARRAYAQGIKINWIVELKFLPGAIRRSLDEMKEYSVWDVAPLTYADPNQFRAYAQPLLEKLEQAGVVLAGFELGNEINTPSYNGDLSFLAREKFFGLTISITMLKDKR